VTQPRTATITALRERPRGRVEIELDGEQWRTVPAGTVVRMGLSVGQALDRATARDLARELRRAKALGGATRALAARDRSRAALDERLAHAGVPAGARAAALDELELSGLVDDARLARSRAEARAARGYGDVAIRARLARDGVSPELTRAALDELEPERERALRLLERDGRSGRTLRRLAARGFEPEIVAELSAFADDR
jgi:SOS response regulatory protein OraA/RecX